MQSGTGKIKRVGVLGGTFDPVHNGHLAIAEEARERVGMLEVLFVPAGQPWMKAGNIITPARQRVEMVRLAIAGKSYFKLATVEVDRPGPTYTVDTLAQLREQSGGRTVLYFIMSWDTLPELPRWKEPSRIIEMSFLVAVPRPGYSRPDLALLSGQIPGLAEKVILLDGPLVDLSATAIRERVANGLPIDNLVPPAVARYIKEKRLYRR